MDINRILVTGRLYKAIESAVGGLPEKEIRFLPEEEVTDEVLNWADAYVSFRPTPNFSFHNIKWVHALGAGVDSFLFRKYWKEDVVLTRTICSFGTKISEYCLSYILGYLQAHDRLKEQKKLGKWEYVEPLSISSQEIIILGTGVIGQELAKNLGSLGVRTIGVSLSGEQKQYFAEVISFDRIKYFLPHANWLINTLPLTDKTEDIINEDIFNNMNNAGFINVGRGGSLDEKALIAAIGRGNIKLAVLDVFKAEPLPVSSELWNNPQIHVTPHISAITSVDEAVKCFLDTLNNIENGSAHIKNLVDIKKGY